MEALKKQQLFLVAIHILMFLAKLCVQIWSAFSLYRSLHVVTVSSHVLKLKQNKIPVHRQGEDGGHEVPQLAEE